MGFSDSPLELTPREYLPDPAAGRPRRGRFDDPLGDYRVLYATRYQRDALRETLQSFRRTSTKMEELLKLHGKTSLEPPTIPPSFLDQFVLAEGLVRLRPSTRIAKIENPQLIRQIEVGLADTLRTLGLERLDIPELRGRYRHLTQLIGRFLHGRGVAGIVFRSVLPPGGSCLALFEGRGWLEATGRAFPLSSRPPALGHVTREFGLTIS